MQFIKNELADAKITLGGLRDPVAATTLEMTPIRLPIMNEEDFDEAESSLKNESVCQNMVIYLTN